MCVCVYMYMYIYISTYMWVCDINTTVHRPPYCENSPFWSQYIDIDSVTIVYSFDNLVYRLHILHIFLEVSPESEGSPEVRSPEVRKSSRKSEVGSPLSPRLEKKKKKKKTFSVCFIFSICSTRGSCMYVSVSPRI